MKKILSLVLVLAMLLTSFSFAAADPVTVGEELKALGVLKGDENGNLKPEQNLTAEQAIIVLVRLMGKEADAKATTTAPSFTDVPAGNYYAPYIAYAQLQGWTNGEGNGKFGFGKTVTIERIYGFMLKALGYTTLATNAEFVAKATELGLNKDVTAEAGKDVLRGQVFLVMNNTLNTVPKDGKIALVYALKLKPEPVVTKFEVKDVKAANLREVEITFTDAVKAVDKANFLLGSTAADSVTLSADKKVATAIFTMVNQSSYKLTIKSVKNEKDVEIKDYTKEFSVNDFTAPTVVGIKVTGNKKLEVTFSEPVTPATANILGNYKINGLLFGGVVTTEGRVVTIVTSARLPEGTHKLVVSSDVLDYANYKLVSNTTDFVVAKDEVKPAVAKVDSATQVKVVVTFTKPVEDSFTVSAAVGTFVDKSTKDNLTYTLNFLKATPLPLSGTEITMTDVTDYFGNKDTLKVNVIPTIDLVRPEVVSVTQTAQNKLVVEFSKDVDATTGTYTLKTVETTPVTIAAPTVAAHIDTDVTPNKTYDNKMVLTFASNLAVKKYTLAIAGVKDLSPLANVQVPATKDVEVKDMVKPTVASVKVTQPTTTTAGVLFIEFSEKVDAVAAVAKANYSFIIDSTTPVALGDSHTVTLLADGKTVKIAVPKFAAGQTAITSLTVVNVTDVAGNKMASFVTTTLTAYAAPAVTVTGLKAVAKNKVEITVPAGINPTTVTASDFIVKSTSTPANVIYVVNAEYAADDNKITLTLNEDLTNDASYKLGGTVYLEVIATNLANIYGEKVALGNKGVIADSIVPMATKLASATATGTAVTLVVELSENLATSTFAPVDYVIVINNVKYDATTAVYAAAAGSDAAKVTITVNANTGLVGKTARINCFKSANLADTAGNQLASYEYTATLK